MTSVWYNDKNLYYIQILKETGMTEYKTTWREIIFYGVGATGLDFG